MQNENDLTVQADESITGAGSKCMEWRERVDKIFRDLAIYETISIDDRVADMFAAKVREVRTARPDLDEVEIYVVAGRLLKQLIRCYQSALEQLLP